MVLMVEMQLPEGLDNTLQYQALVLLLLAVVVVGTTLLLFLLPVELVEVELVAILIHTTVLLGLLIQGAGEELATKAQVVRA